MGAYLDQASDFSKKLFYDDVESLQKLNYEILEIPMLENIVFINEYHMKIVSYSVTFLKIKNKITKSILPYLYVYLANFVQYCGWYCTSYKFYQYNKF